MLKCIAENTLVEQIYKSKKSLTWNTLLHLTPKLVRIIIVILSLCYISQLIEYEKFMQVDSHHKIGDVEVQVTPYHPMLAVFDEKPQTDLTPPPVPPRLVSHRSSAPKFEPNQYQHAPHTEPIDEPLSKYLMHVLYELNSRTVCDF